MSDNVIDDVQKKIQEEAYQANCASARSYEGKINDCIREIGKYKKKKTKYESFKSNASGISPSISTVDTSIKAIARSYFEDGGIVGFKSQGNMKELSTSAEDCGRINSTIEEAVAFCDAKIKEYEQKIEESTTEANGYIDSFNSYATAANGYKQTFDLKSKIQNV